MVETIYQPRKPKLSPLYQSIVSHFSEFESVYEECYQKRCGVLRNVVREVLYKYLGCGDLRKGFARIKCKNCNHEVLLAFSKRDHLRSILRFDKLTVPRKIEGQPGSLKASLPQCGVNVQPYPQIGFRLT